MKIVIVEPLGITKQQIDELAAKFLADDVQLVAYDTLPENDEVKIERLQGAKAAVVANMPLRENVLKYCPDLKFLSVAFTGVDHIDMAYCKAHDIMVCNCSGYANEAVSELVFGAVLALYRDIFAADKAVRQGGTRAGLTQYELCGKKFGIVGAGAIGLKVAALAKAFGCDVYAYSRTAKDIDGVKFVSLDELMSSCDIISVHVPLTEATTDLINAANIMKMKRNAVLINTARGAVVNTDALAIALQEGLIAGAAVDVFAAEPPIAKEHPLLHTPHTLVMPHIGFATAEAMVKRANIAFANIKAWMNGKPQNVMK